MRTIEAQGYNKEKALESTGLDVQLNDLKNATQAWKKQGSPMNTKDLNKFLADYVKTNKTVGAYIVVDAASDDTRTRPYTVLTETSVGKSKYVTTYLIKEADFKVKTVTRMVEKEKDGVVEQVEAKVHYKVETVTYESTNKETGEKEVKTKEIEIPLVSDVTSGLIVGQASKKDDAIRLMKELTELNKRDYVIEKVKMITEGNPYAAYSKYTPSASAKLGKFVFFVRE